MHTVQTVAVLGAGNGGKATAADLCLQGKTVRLYEVPEFVEKNLTGLEDDPVLECTGDLKGSARLDLISGNLKSVLGLDANEGIPVVDTIVICTVVQTHVLIAELLVPFLREWPGENLPMVVLNPGSTGGSLVVAKVWHELQLKKLPVLVEFGTLTYGCRATGRKIHVTVKVKRVSYGVFPSKETSYVGDCFEKLFPGLFLCPSVIAAGLSNANPVIHPAITLLNLGRMEQQGEEMFFYKDGASPLVCKLIEALDEERMAIMRALGYDEIVMPDHTNSMLQGYAESDATYYECFGLGKGFGEFRCPPKGTNLTAHRYFTEDIGRGLVFYHSLGSAIGVPTPVSDTVISMGSVLAEVYFLGQNAKSVSTLGLDGMGKQAIQSYLETGEVTEVN